MTHREVNIDNSFTNFLGEGTAGRTLFEEHVVPLLTPADLINGANTCRVMNSACRMYTVTEILRKHQLDIEINHKLALESFLGFLVRSRFNEDAVLHKRTRWQYGGLYRAQENLYHPNQVAILECAILLYCREHDICCTIDVGEIGSQFEEVVGAELFLWQTNAHAQLRLRLDQSSHDFASELDDFVGENRNDNRKVCGDMLARPKGTRIVAATTCTVGALCGIMKLFDTM